MISPKRTWREGRGDARGDALGGPPRDVGVPVGRSAGTPGSGTRIAGGRCFGRLTSETCSCSDSAAETDLYYSREPVHFAGQLFVWCVKHNHGGNLGMRGRLSAIATGPAAAMTPRVPPRRRAGNDSRTRRPGSDRRAGCSRIIRGSPARRRTARVKSVSPSSWGLE